MSLSKEQIKRWCEQGRRIFVNEESFDALCDMAEAWRASQAAGERTDKDYAIEHAEYLAVAAEGYMGSVDDYIRAVQEASEKGRKGMDYNAVTDSLGDHWKALKNAVYEFRKRATLASRPESAAVEATAAKETTQVVPKEPTDEMVAAGALITLGDPSPKDFEQARRAAKIVLMLSPGPTPGTLEGIAAVIATMIPFYRAMLAAAPVCPRPEEKDIRALYHELLYQVGHKHPNETRHETALRYLRQAEAPQNNPPACATPRNTGTHE